MPYYAAQPIIGADEQVIAHEILHRTSKENRFPFGVSPDSATSSVLFCLFGNNIKAAPLDGGRPAFINFSGSAIRNRLWKDLDPNNVVIELLENCDINSEFLDSVLEAKSLGFSLAIDDYSFESKWEPLLDMVDIIKFDSSQIDINELTNASLKIEKKPGQLWLAEKVECRLCFDRLRAADFDLFQGFLWGKPEVHEVRLPNPFSLSFESELIEFVA
ncbi:EAL and HDOD domain-containing protein [Vibrio owensii]|uniref:EAL and HDOD domain-containing protein n=1 Tax=Vibrio harveyi group TaxID=717610 RepID=UPI003CC676CE